MMKKILFFILVFSSLIPIHSQSTSGFSVEKLLEFDAYIKGEIEAEQIAGAEVLIAKNRSIVWHKSFGEQNMELKIPLAPNSIYYIQSMTKPLISVAIMQLIEKGILKLENPVHLYLPEVKNIAITTAVELGLTAPTKPIKNVMTLKNLLTHTAGFSHGLESHKYDQELFALLYKETLDYKGHPNLESRVDVLMQAPLLGEPGEQWVYSAAPDLLALILQRASKETIPEYLKEYIFDPLGMVDTGYNLTEEQAQRVMQLHTDTEFGGIEISPMQVPTQGNTVFGGTHGLFSTATDYLRFCQMILNRGQWNGVRILSEESVTTMTKNHVGALLGGARGFGLGFGVIRDAGLDPGPGSTGQLYWGGYFRTHFFIDPAKELIALFMTQKLPHQKNYAVALNQYIYAALE